MDSEEIELWDQESERAWQHDNHEAEFSQSIVSLLREILQPNTRILDAGCGIGKHIGAFTKLGYVCDGIDQSKVAVKYAKTLNQNANIRLMRIQDLDYQNIYDLIYTCAVLQHSSHDRKRVILKKFYDALCAQGFILCTENTLSEDLSDGYSFSENGWIKFMAENNFKHIKTILPWPFYLFQVIK